jgi:hypothetical protein
MPLIHTFEEEQYEFESKTGCKEAQYCGSIVSQEQSPDLDGIESDGHQEIKNQ